MVNEADSGVHVSEVVGCWNWQTARQRYFLHGLTLSLVISNPAYPTVSAAKKNLVGLRVIPYHPLWLSQFTAWWKLLPMSPTHIRVSSMHFVLLGMLIRLVKLFGVSITQYYITLGRGLVPISSPELDEGGEMAVAFM